MCGILGVFGYVGGEQDLRRLLLTAMKRLRHRGPDWSGLHIQYYASSPGKVNGFAHERLSIVDPLGGAQPLLDTSRRVVLCVNGEIFNHKQLRAELSDYAYTTHSDCEVILPGYLRDKEKFVSKLRGQFSFILSDSANDTFVVARDAIGVCPLYYGIDTNGAMWFSSEMKVLEMSCQSYKVFPPGNVYVHTKDGGTWTQYYNPIWWDEAYVPPALPLTEDGPYSSVDYAALRNAFIDSVKKRLMCDVPFGVLLSGGLDSSLVASIVTRIMKEGSFCEGEWFGRLHSFSIGLPDSPDLKAARLVAKFLGTKHYEMTFTLQEAKDALRDVIYHLETYDITTIRASTPMYLMSRKIKSMGVKMVLSGEGADEVFGGYLYFHKAPNKEEFQAELVRKLKSLHLYDCLRADKSTMAWGLEARVPFLDTDFLDVAMAIDPAAKMITPNHMEKYVLRKAFDTPDNPYLPESVLWRQKEQFSDGVGYGWIDCLRDLANIQVTDVMFGHRALRFPYNTPTTKEGYMFRDIFEQLFHNPCGVVTVPGGPSIACSTPTAIRWAKEWENAADPSGRAILSVHVSHKRKANSGESDQQDKRVKT